MLIGRDSELMIYLFHFKHLIYNFKFSDLLDVKNKTWAKIIEEQLIQPFASRIIQVYSEWQQDNDMIRGDTLV